MVARTGSLGITEDLWKMLHVACYEDPEHGHRWEPPQEIVDIIRWSDEALAQSWGRAWEPLVPFSPSCGACRTAAKNMMLARGIDREIVKRYFEKVGARWSWACRATDEARKMSDAGEMVPDPDGPGFVLTTTLAARRRRQEARVAMADRKPDMRHW